MANQILQIKARTIVLSLSGVHVCFPHFVDSLFLLGIKHGTTEYTIQINISMDIMYLCQFNSK